MEHPANIRGQHEATGQSLASFNIYILGPSLLFLFLVILQHTARILVFVTFKPWLSVAYLVQRLVNYILV